MTTNGLITVASPHAVPDTIDRIVAAIAPLGLIVFARIDHAQGAASVGMPLRPTQLLIFGNPKGGTPLMQDQQTAGIDLPLKMLAWEDAGGKVWLTWNDAEWIAQRHGLGVASAAAVAAIATAMQKIANAAAQKS
jgi:uncharacterized protein (DUF302 family)